jgi:hypothetical protein
MRSHTGRLAARTRPPPMQQRLRSCPRSSGSSACLAPPTRKSLRFARLRP